MANPLLTDSLWQLVQPLIPVRPRRFRLPGHSKGFGFVEMVNDAKGKRAITALKGQDFSGRSLTVNKARPRTSNGPGGSGYRGNR